MYTDASFTYGAFTSDFEGGAITRPFRRLAFASFPATCTANREFLERSDPATAGQVLYVCNSAGTGWDLVGDGGAGGGASTADAFVTIGHPADLTAERNLAGTTGNLTVTDGGANGDVTLDLGTTAVQTDQGNTYSTGAQDMGSATSLVVPKAAGAAPTADGDVRYDTTQDTLMAGGSGAITGSIPRVLATFFCNSTTCACVGTGCTAGTYTNNCVSGGADTNCTNAGTTETNFGMNFSIPANFFIANKLLRVTVACELTTSGSPPTFQPRFKLGTTVTATQVATAPAASLTSRACFYEFILQGTAAPGASVNIEAASGGVASRTTDLVFGLSANTVAQPVAVATNAAQTLQLSLQLGTATIGNFVRLRQMIIEELN